MDWAGFGFSSSFLSAAKPSETHNRMRMAGTVHFTIRSSSRGGRRCWDLRPQAGVLKVAGFARSANHHTPLNLVVEVVHDALQGFGQGLWLMRGAFEFTHAFAKAVDLRRHRG